MVGINDQQKINFMNKEAFIIIYDRTSLNQINRLPDWVNNVFSLANRKYKVILLLGNKMDEDSQFESQIQET
jgi:GTPase SAR1 family protein